MEGQVTGTSRAEQTADHTQSGGQNFQQTAGDNTDKNLGNKMTASDDSSTETQNQKTTADSSGTETESPSSKKTTDTGDVDNPVQGEGEDGGEVSKVPREHGRLDVLLSQIPKKAQHGLLMQCDLILTCIDANQQFIALGTNIGLTFLYNRQDHSMQRLRSETSSDVITCVKLHHGVDDQVAAGMASGMLCIFFIPGPISLAKKQLQKFDVRSVHKHYISCVEWSTNGMKLFTGDKAGNVVVTEVDFYQGQCKSCLLLVEPPTEVVQLHYDHRVLLVSTRHRSFLCRLDTTGHLTQVGQQDRKTQGNFGAAMIPGLRKVDNVQLYAVRPGCRVWLSDIHGNVLHTYMFKDLLSAGHPDIPLLHPAPRSTTPTTELQFGPLHMYCTTQLLTYNTSTLFILDPVRNRVVGSQKQLGGIVDVAVHEDEVLVLRRHGDTAVVRIAQEPEVLFQPGVPQEVPSIPPSIPTPKAASSSTAEKAGSAGGGGEEGVGVEENKATQFFKKTFLSPFKKLDTLLQPKEPSPQDLRPVIRSADPDHTPPKTTTTSPTPPLPYSQNSSPDLPPVVPLDSPDLAVRVYTPLDVQSPDSAHSALSMFAEEVVSPTTTEGKAASAEDHSDRTSGEGVRTAEGEPEATSTQEADSQDIIFSHHMNRKKVKKKDKKAKGKGQDKEGDSISQSSLGSQGGENRRGGDGQKINEVLRRAEEALSSVDRLLKNGEEGKEAGQVTPHVATDTSGMTAADSQSTAPSSTLTDQQQNTRQDTAPATAHTRQVAVDSGILETTAEQHTASAGGRPSDHALQTLPGENRLTTASPGHAVSQASVSSGQKLSQPATQHTVNAAPPSSLISSNAPSHPAPQSSLTTGSAPSHPAPQSSLTTGSAPSHPAREEVDPLVAAERALDSMTRRSRLPSKKQESIDDFYSKFSSPYSPTDPTESPPITPTHSCSLSSTEASIERQTSTGSGVSEGGGSVGGGGLHRTANSWSEFSTPANIYSLGLSTSHVWFTDKSDNLYYSALGAVKGIVWRKVGEQASQISVSPSGHIVWRLHRGRVFAGTKITHRRPEGLKWVEAVNNVLHISADDHTAWYVKVGGEVLMQRGLSKERPCFRSLPVETEIVVRQVMARYGVVWAITDAMTLLVRTGISNDTPQGLAWHQVVRETEPYLFSSVTLDNEGIGWAVDVLGQIWFTDQVTPQNPVGSGHWWQVPLSEYYVQDPGVLDVLRSMARKLDSQKLSKVLSTKRGGLVTAGDQGVWLVLDYLNTLYVCRSSLQGYHWSAALPPHMAASTPWKQVSAAAASMPTGMVWAQQVNGELYAMHPDSSDATLTPTPSVLVSYSVNEVSFWGLTSEGMLYVRTGMGPHCPLGVDWVCLDLLQLGDVFLVHVSCNNSYVWVVDGDGRVFHRIGAAAPRPGQLNPVWLPIDVYTEIVFTKVVTGPLDWMVWAVDNRRLTYVRVGVCEDLPIGKEWVHVPGIQAMDLCVSGSGVWALNTNGEILFRYGVTPGNVSGNYWKKIPGCFTRISASSQDMLWGVTTSGQLLKCSSRLLLRRQNSADPLLQRSLSTASEEGEWELV
ncbi:tectonin beta-propeller repeat-containing protein 2-like [Babylonia areolata]|uniref:tectonin beta-propeller repeat-containing protein 2-like n=1 Tax=Babylonia areolata TaxID=304850 RepID=UPI003FD1209B